MENGSAHWSKDFVEHLRTVHFTLITVSAGLLLLIASFHPYRPADAVAQLEKIVDARQHWDFTRLLTLHRSSSDVTGENPPSFTITMTKGRNQKITFTARFTDVWVPKMGLKKDEVLYKSQPPDDLRSFKHWWEAHLKERTFVVATLFKGDGVLEATDDDDKVSEIGKVVYVPHPQKKPDLILDMWLQPDAGSGTGWTFAGLYDGEFHIPAYTTEATLHAADFIDVPARCDSFDKCFPDLAKATTGVDILKLDDLKTQLIGQLDKGDSVFEAFGLKVPQSQLTFWGIAIVLCVQLYLFLPLKELQPKLKEGDSGWEVAWIGVYGSFPSRLVFFGSVVVLPFTTVGLIVFRAVASVARDSGIRAWQSWVQFGCLGISLILCVFIAILTWSHRPLAATESEGVAAMSKASGGEEKSVPAGSTE